MDFSSMMRDNRKAVIVVASLLVCGVLCLCLQQSSPVYRIIHKGAAKKLEETLMSEEWVCYDMVSLAGVEAKAGRMLVFNDGTVSSYIIPDGNFSLQGKEMIVRKLENEWTYDLINGSTFAVDIPGMKLKSKVSFEENGDVLVLSPSLPYGEKTKKWCRKARFIEKYPEHAKLFKD
ncbi:MAG: hypothetical protein VZR27_03085 [Acutalibacteraceae bacterium]|nr:hypothetical protein [Clostridia bacterium]MEE3449674.1 hypothetical protein [Acutalibacteraceae bacterium]